MDAAPVIKEEAVDVEAMQAQTKTREEKARCRNDGCDYLATVNAHPSDARADFTESTHTYTVDGEKVTRSGTALVHSVFPDDFNGREIVDRYYDNWKRKDDPRYARFIQDATDKDGVVDDERAKLAILASWNEKKNEASSSGTKVHAWMERLLNRSPDELSAADRGIPEFPNGLEKECKQLLDFMQSEFATSRGLCPVRTELVTWWKPDWLGKAVSAGQIDALFVDNRGKHWIFDWKRVANNKPLDGSDGERNGYGSGSYSHLQASTLNKYSLQTNLYMHMAKETHGYDLSPDRLYLVRVHSDRDEYELAKCVDLSQVAEQVLYEESLARQNRA